MPLQIHSHTVFGFSDSLDWSTLHFVKPIDDIRVCSACKAVARKTAFLACRHVLCEPCHEHWKSRGSHVCFLDGDLCPENEVHWMEFPVEKMMKTEVSCWNRENGCDTIIDVSSIAEHFHRDCAYHSTSCSVCSSTVLRKDIIAHLESQCVNYVLRIRLTTSRSEEELKDLNDIREGVRGIEMAVRSAFRKDGLLVTSLQEVTEKGVDNVDHLSGIAAEASWVSQAMRKTFSEIERSSEGRVNEIVDTKTCKDSLCAELDEIKRAADQLRSCETAEQQEMREHEECANKLQALNAEMQSVSGMLEESMYKLLPEADVAESLTVHGLSEVLSSHAFSQWLSSHWRRPPVFLRMK